uniref:Uncharacterized protein n=1 Tax=Anguilla anguilla TaxID=7936 RepID=A0A0E9S7D0_ANGAN
MLLILKCHHRFPWHDFIIFIKSGSWGPNLECFSDFLIPGGTRDGFWTSYFSFRAETHTMGKVLFLSVKAVYHL